MPVRSTLDEFEPSRTCSNAFDRVRTISQASNDSSIVRTQTKCLPVHSPFPFQHHSTLTNPRTHSGTYSTAFEQVRTSSTNSDQARTSKNIPKFGRTIVRAPFKAQNTSYNPHRPRAIVETFSNNSRTTLEHHPIGFRAILSYSAAVFLIDNECAYSPRCPRSYGTHIG